MFLNLPINGREYIATICSWTLQKSLQRWKKNWFSKKKWIEWRQILYYNYKKTIQFKEALLLIRENIRNFFSFFLMLKKFSLNKQKMWNWSSGIATWFWRSNFLKYIFWGSKFLQEILKCIFNGQFFKEIFEGAVLEINFLREQFITMYFFSRKFFEMYFLLEQFLYKKNLKCIFKIFSLVYNFWGSNFWREQFLKIFW